MSEQPTEKQVKEFWEGYGLHYTEPYWVDENGNLAFYGEVHSELMKSINLNNLFKYTIFNQCKRFTDTDDPALALFWALHSLIDKTPK